MNGRLTLPLSAPWNNVNSPLPTLDSTRLLPGQRHAAREAMPCQHSFPAPNWLQPGTVVISMRMSLSERRPRRLRAHNRGMEILLKGSGQIMPSHLLVAQPRPGTTYTDSARHRPSRKHFSRRMSQRFASPVPKRQRLPSSLLASSGTTSRRRSTLGFLVRCGSGSSDRLTVDRRG